MKHERAIGVLERELVLMKQARDKHKKAVEGLQYQLVGAKENHKLFQSYVDDIEGLLEQLKEDK